MQGQSKKELWLDGVEDYIQYAKEIIKDFEDVIDAPSGLAAGGIFNFGKPATSAAPAGLVFGGSSTPAFSGQPPNSSGNGLRFGGFNNSEVPSTNAEPVEGEETPQEQPSELEVDTSKADIMYSERLHLMSQNSDTKKWTDRGTGSFTLRLSKPESEGDKRIAYIVFTTDAGKVLINAPVLKGLKPMINQKAPANVIMLLITKDEDGSEQKGMHIFKCGSSETANAVVDAVSKQA